MNKLKIFDFFFIYLYLMNFSFLDQQEINQNNVTEINQNNVTEINYDNFDEITKNNKYLVFDFYANWCTPCKIASPEIEGLSSTFKNVKFCKINVDDNDLVNDYDIEFLPTIMVYSNEDMNNYIFKSESGDMEPLKKFLKSLS